MSRELHFVKLIGADAVGRPGQRRFRLFAHSDQASAIMWIEKEQLNSLSEAIDRSLAFITEGQILRTEAQAGGRKAPLGIPADFPVPPTYEVQTGQMRLSYDEQETHFFLAIVPVEIIIEGDEPQVMLREEELLSCTFSQQQAQQLSRSILDLLAAGRPVCPLCHTPLDGGPHACIKQNGHRNIERIEEVSNEDE